MSSDANVPRSSPPAAAPVPTVRVPVNGPTPIDSGIRVETRRVPVNELPGAGGRPEAAPAVGGVAAAKLPRASAVLQRMVVGALAGRAGKLGEERTRQLYSGQARLVGVEHAQYTSPGRHGPEHIAPAPKTPQPLDGGVPGPGLLAAIATHKYDEHQPLYRQELSLWR